MAYTSTRHLGDAVQHARTPKQKDPVVILRGLFALAKGSTNGKHTNIFSVIYAHVGNEHLNHVAISI